MNNWYSSAIQDTKLNGKYESCITGKSVAESLLSREFNLKDKYKPCTAVVLDKKWNVYGVTNTKCDTFVTLMCQVR